MTTTRQEFWEDYGDRYRTAAVEVGYLVSNETQLIAGINLFTGEPGEGGFLSREAGGTGRYGSYTMIRADGSDVTARDRSVGNAYVGLRGLNLASSEFERAIGLDDLQIKVGWSSEAIRGATQKSVSRFDQISSYSFCETRLGSSI